MTKTLVEASHAVGTSSGKSDFEIKYRYTFKNKVFHSDCYQLVPFFSTTSTDVNSLIGKYPIGSTIKVHVNPSHPDRAFVSVAPLAWWAVLAFLLGLFALYRAAYYMWRTMTAYCVYCQPVNTSTGSGGVRYYFFDSIEQGQKAREYKLQESTLGTRIKAAFPSVLFACVGLGVLLFLLWMPHDGLPQWMMIFGWTVAILFALAGVAGMWYYLSVKYVLELKNGLGQSRFTVYKFEENFRADQYRQK